MPNYRDLDNGCSTVGCKGEGLGAHGKCASCIDKLVSEGWKIRASGTLVRQGVKITPSGRVTVEAMYNPRMMALMSGDMPVEDLDEEELARGMCRNEDGTMPRRAPTTVPRVMIDRMQRELFARAEETLKTSLVASAESLARLAADPEADANTRLKAATWLYERILGKAATEVKITQDKPWENVLTKVKRGPRPPVAPTEPVG